MGEVVLKRLYFYISTMEFVKMSTMSFSSKSNAKVQQQ